MKKLDLSHQVVDGKETDDGIDINYTPAEMAAQFVPIYKEISANLDIEVLELAGNWIYDKEIIELANILSSHRELRCLNLSYSQPTLTSVPAFKKIIGDHPKLQTIYLENSGITDDFIKELVEGNSASFNERLSTIRISVAGTNKMTAESINIARTSRLSMDTKLAIIASPQFYIGGQFQVAANKFREELIAAIEVDKNKQIEKENIQPLIHSAAAIISSSIGSQPKDEKTLSENKNQPTIK